MANEHATRPANGLLRKLANIFTGTERIGPDSTGAAGVAADANVDPDHEIAGAFGAWRGPIGDIGVDADSGTVVVSNYGDDTVSVIHPDHPSVEGIPVDGEPVEICVANDLAFVATSSAGYDAVTVVDTVTKVVTATYPLAFTITAVAVSPDGKRVFAGRAGNDTVDIAVIDTTAERVGTIDIGGGPAVSIDALRLDATGKRLYVAMSDVRGGRLLQVNVETARVESALRVDAPIRDLAIGADGAAYLLTSDRVRGGVIAVVDLAANAVTGVVGIGGAPTQMAITPDGTRLYIVDYDHVAVLCVLTNEVVNTVTVGARPSCVALSADGSSLYVADCAGEVTAFSITATKPLRYSATGMRALSPRRRALERATA